MSFVFDQSITTQFEFWSVERTKQEGYTEIIVRPRFGTATRWEVYVERKRQELEELGVELDLDLHVVDFDEELPQLIAVDWHYDDAISQWRPRHCEIGIFDYGAYPEAPSESELIAAGWLAAEETIKWDSYAGEGGAWDAPVAKIVEGIIAGRMTPRASSIRQYHLSLADVTHA